MSFYGFSQNLDQLNGPNIIFEPNINPKAKSLRQGLNKSRDTLKLLSTKLPITQIDIFNKDYLESFDVNSNKTEIALDLLPAGTFLVQARVGRKRIIMSLTKKEGLDLATLRKKEALALDDDKEDLQEDTTKQKKRKKPKKKRKAKYFWVVYESNSNMGSRKSMKLLYKDEVLNLIQKNKYELESGVANDNVLTVYAIYNKNKFMNKQYRNPKFYKTIKKPKLFNPVPFYNSSEAVVNKTSS